MTVESQYMKLWTVPQYYMGAEWPEYYQAIGHNRDSDNLDNSNFDCFVKAIKELPEPKDWAHEESCYQVINESHWACGWVEWLGIHSDWAEGVQLADRLLAKIADYPVLDDEDYSNRNSETSYESIQEALRQFLNKYADLTDDQISQVEYQIGQNANEDYIDSWPTDSEIIKAISQCGIVLELA